LTASAPLRRRKPGPPSTKRTSGATCSHARVQPLNRDDGPADLNWRQVSEILAEQLDALAARLADAPDNTDADDERVARAAVALRQYRAACTETDDLT
jgi:hypothetical protein